MNVTDASGVTTSESASTYDRVKTAETRTTNTAAAAADYAASGEYGFSDWVAGTTHDTLLLNSDGSSRTVADNTIRNVVFVDTAADPDTLSFGPGVSATEPYPTTITISATPYHR